MFVQRFYLHAFTCEEHVRNAHHVLVDEVEDHIGEARAAPVAVDQKQLAEVFEPGDGKVTGHHSLRITTQTHQTDRQSVSSSLSACNP